MSKEVLSVFIFGVIISLSGIIINFIKNNDNRKIKLTTDGSTLFWFRILVPIALLASLLFYLLKLGHFPVSKPVLIIGYVLIVSGLIIRWYAIYILGKAFTVKVTILEDHNLKTDNIYKWIRHPSYTGLLMYYLGLGLIMQNWICIILLVLFPLAAVFIRISVEENVLLENFSSEYQMYQKHSWKLFPFLY